MDAIRDFGATLTRGGSGGVLVAGEAVALLAIAACGVLGVGLARLRGVASALQHQKAEQQGEGSGLLNV